MDRIRKIAALAGQARMLEGAQLAADADLGAGGPFFLYDLDAFTDRVREFTQATDPLKTGRTRVYFPMFANPNLALVRRLAEDVPSGGILVNSPEEAEVLSEEAFIDSGRLVFTGGVLGKTKLSQVAAHCNTVHCASLGDLNCLLEIAAESANPPRIGLRVDLRGGALKGLTRGDCEIAVRRARAAGMQISSLHSYPGTEVESIEALQADATLLLEFWESLQAAVLNFGGGFGYDYRLSRGSFNIRDFFDRFWSEIRFREKAGRLASDVLFAWEPGRLVGAGAGAYVCRVLEVRPRESGYFDVYVDGTFAHLPAPKIRNRQHRVSTIQQSGESGERLYWSRLCGATTLSTDTLLPGHVLMPPVVPGDLVMVWDVGCYGRSASHNFLCRRLPAEVGIENSSLRLLRPAQLSREVFGLSSEPRAAAQSSRLGIAK